MERNFTDERKNEVRDVIEASLLRWIQLDLQIERNSELAPELGLNVAIDCAEAYRERVIQKLQKSLEVLEEKYKDTNNIDKSYATNHIADAIKSIQSLNTYILRLAESLYPENGGMDAGKASALNAMWNSYELLINNVQQKREFAYDVESIVYGLDGTRRNVEWVAIKQQEYVVEAYELLHPEMKEKMNKFLSTGDPNVLTANDITSIKYLAYTAPEPYRTVYLEYVGTYEIGYISEENIDYEKSRAWFRPSNNKIYMENTSEYLTENPRGDYTTFFHECGHATDYNFSDIDKDYFCKEYIFYDSDGALTLQKAIYNDVYNDIANTIYVETVELDKLLNTDSKSFNSENVDTMNVLKAFIPGSEFVKLSEEEVLVRESVKSFYSEEYTKDKYTKDKYEAVSDVYGGVTNLMLFEEEGYGHRGKNKLGQYNYWYEWDGEPTMAQSKEFVAIYFSQLMTGDREAIEATREHFPEASKVMDEMFMSMKETIDNR